MFTHRQTDRQTRLGLTFDLHRLATLTWVRVPLSTLSSKTRKFPFQKLRGKPNIFRYVCVHVCMYVCLYHITRYLLRPPPQTLYIDDHLMLCDCPGLVFPRFVATKAEMVCSGILPIDQMRDPTPPTSLVS